MIAYFKLISFLVITASLFLLPKPVSAQRKVAAQANAISLATELSTFYKIANLPLYNEQTKVAQVSSYDRTGWNDDGFSGKYSFVRRNKDSSLVLFDEKGPGVINRIWTPTPTEDSIDFYIDDTLRPAFTIQYLDLFSGKVFPFVAPLCNNQLGGYYAYLPIPFQKHCKIVLRGKHHMFYQIGFRSYPKETRVKSFNPNLDAEEKESLQRLQTLWNKKTKTVEDFIAATDKNAVQVIHANVQLRKGESQTMMQMNKGGRIVGIELEPAAAFSGLAKAIDLKITWDGETIPAVHCPVADFFGYAYGTPSMQSLLIGSSGITNYSYFPMPFDKSAKVELIYRNIPGVDNQDSIQVAARIYYLPQPRMPQKEGKFYTFWNHQPFVPLGQPHVLLHTGGKGHYVGTVLLTRGLEPGMTGFFEGDDSTVIDGEMRMHGTGSEDYFNGGWYAMMDRWDGAFSLPLSGSLDYTLPLSRTGGYRLFLSDKMPFTKNIYHSIEHGPEHNLAPATYTSVAYYYSNTPPAKAVSPQEVITTVSMPDTMIIYPQLLTYNTTGDITSQRRWKYNTGGEAVIFSGNSETGVRVHLQEVPDGTYKVFLDYAKHPQGGLFSVWQRQTPLTGWMPSAATEMERVERQYIADVTLGNHNQTLTLRFKPDGKKNEFFLNRIILVKVKE